MSRGGAVRQRSCSRATGRSHPRLQLHDQTCALPSTEKPEYPQAVSLQPLLRTRLARKGPARMRVPHTNAVGDVSSGRWCAISCEHTQWRESVRAYRRYDRASVLAHRRSETDAAPASDASRVEPWGKQRASEFPIGYRAVGGGLSSHGRPRERSSSSVGAPTPARFYRSAASTAGPGLLAMANTARRPAPLRLGGGSSK